MHRPIFCHRMYFCMRKNTEPFTMGLSTGVAYRLFGFALLLAVCIFAGCRCDDPRNGTSADGSAGSNAASGSGKKIQIVTTSTDFRDICKRVAGDSAEVKTLARGDQNLHGIEARPAHITMLQKADVYFAIGAGMDDWANRFIKSSGNRKIKPGGKNHVDVGKHISLLEKPAAGARPSGKPLHLAGNPHYWLNPENTVVIAKVMCSTLSKLYPDSKTDFEKGRDDFIKKIEAAKMRWKKKMRSCRGRKIITYHKSWSYFAAFFSLVEAGVIEPQPGIPPSPAHISTIIDKVKRERISVVLSEPCYPLKMPRMIAKQTGAAFLVLPTSVDGADGTGTYIKLMDHAVDKISSALKKGGQ